MFYIIFGITAGVVLLVLLFKSGSAKSLKKTEWYKHWGQRLLLEHRSEKFMLGQLNTLEGKLENVPVKIYEEITGFDNSSQYLHTFIVFEPNPFDFTFKIGRKNLCPTPDFTLEDDSIDEHFCFYSPQPNKVKALMNSEARLALLRIGHELGTGIESDAKKLIYSQLGGPTSNEQIERLDHILHLMRILIKNK